MALFKTTKNVFFQDLDITVLESDVVELDDATAKDLIEKLADVFPDRSYRSWGAETKTQSQEESRNRNYRNGRG